MLRERSVQPDYWDLILPENGRRMSPELETVDYLLDDERFLTPFRVAWRDRQQFVERATFVGSIMREENVAQLGRAHYPGDGVPRERKHASWAAME
jgi:hypothetical protein